MVQEISIARLLLTEGNTVLKIITWNHITGDI